MPTVTATINETGGQVSWSIQVSDLKAAVYRAVLFDTNDTVLQTWNNQRTTDSLADDFTISVPNATLKAGTTLWWQAIVTDPAATGGSYTVAVTVTQDGTTIATDTTPGQVPAGKGRMDAVSDSIVCN